MHMLDSMTFIPRGNMVLVDRLRPDEKSRGGIIFPDVAKENPLMGVVVAMGPGKTFVSEQTGARSLIPIADLNVGDTVFFNIRAAVPCNTREQGPDSRLSLVDADQILAVVKMKDAERN